MKDLIWLVLVGVNDWITLSFFILKGCESHQNLSRSSCSSWFFEGIQHHSGWNNLILIDQLFKWTLRRAHSALVYRCASGEHCKPTTGVRAMSWWGLGAMPQEKFFCLCLQNRGKLAHRQNDILVLFCTTSTRHVCYKWNQKLFLQLCKTYFSWHFYKWAIRK